MFLRALVLVWFLCCWGAVAVSGNSVDSYSLRLAKGDGRCRGELQVRGLWRGQEWVKVRPLTVPLWFGNRICAELDCGSALTVKQKKLSYKDAVFLQPESCVDDFLYNCFDNKTHRTRHSLTVSCSGGLAVNESTTEPYRLRLVGGGGRCRGQLQVKRNGEDWTGVGLNWVTEHSRQWSVPLHFGHRLCAELGCGSAVTVRANTEPFGDVVNLSRERCEGPSLNHCFDSYTYQRGPSLELHCSDSVRLVSGRTSCSGSVQIRDQSSDRAWTPVCEGALDPRGAEVLCRELGCGPPLLQGELSPLGKVFQCQGNEAALMDCPRNQTRTDPGTCPPQHLTCSEPLRMVGGGGRCEGTVELRNSGEWRELMSLYHFVDLEAAAVVCRVLDCGPVVSVGSEGRGGEQPVFWNLRVSCVKRLGSVRDCVEGEDSLRSGALKVVCLESVKLVSGRSLCEGSVQIRDQSLDQSWTPVCEGALDPRGAEVLCRELRCGPPLLQGELSPLGNMFQCQGNESALMDCPRNQTRTDPGTCPGPAQHLTCLEPVRLVGGPSRCEGILEVKYSGEWRRAWTYDYLHLWDLAHAADVCRGLDCGAAISTEEKSLDHSGVWHVEPFCVKRVAVRDCVFKYIPSVHYGQEVVCSDSVRLVSGRASCSGPVQIRDQTSDRAWTSLCEGALDRRGAEVLCRELGCGPAVLQGGLSPLGHVFRCQGNESKLMDCPRNQTRTDPGTCSGPALNLTCSEPVRLVGGASRCEGTLEVKVSGDWRRMWSREPWDLEAAAAVCEGLDCGSAVSTEKGVYGFSQVWHLGVSCVKTRRAAARECVSLGLGLGYNSLVVVCSGKLV